MAGIFYFRDMTVLKVMFTALITAMLGLCYCLAFGWVRPESIFFMDTVYGAQIVGGLIFGVGFVMGGWCPGTAAAGLAAGKMDALLFLVGAIGGSVLFNELFWLVKPLYTSGERGVQFVYDTLHVSKPLFAVAFTLAAVVCFWGAEYIEKARATGGALFRSPFLKAFSLALVVAAAGLFLVPVTGTPATAAVAQLATHEQSALGEESLLKEVEQGGDHIEPEELADRLLAGDPNLLLMDVRTDGEYKAFHLPGAVNVGLAQLPQYLAAHKGQKTVVLYSNGMTHPAQVRDALERMGYANIYMLTDGLKGFIERCLKPVSLRGEPIPQALAAKVTAWRNFFLTARSATAVTPTAAATRAVATPVPAASPAPPVAMDNQRLPGLVETQWLADNLGKSGVVVIDMRPQPEYNTSHIPGALSLAVESFRGNVKGLPSMLLPADLLARHLSLMGITPDNLLVFIYSDKAHDATLPCMGLERLGHLRYAVLNGGFGKWAAEKRPMDTVLPSVQESEYKPMPGADTFTVDAATVLKHQQDKSAIIIDVRPPEYFSGAKSDEARAGHIPGAINRPYTEDVVKNEGVLTFKPVADLSAAYAAIVPSKDATVIVHCRTGHQASQTFFVLKRLLGYKDVLYYDAGWTEWAARPELPVEK
ncbi:MAG TPA: DUF6691 family protein [Candidatus Bathyarchaeia archaeon]|nr:DUF6691 family protein [Candidatus Bathyarchaeia archaeon]